MSRPKPKILLKHTDTNNYRTEEILKADVVYAVFYNGHPINIKTYTDLASDSSSPKYKKTIFPNSGHAHTLAKRLNGVFNTDKFTVIEMTNGTLHKK